MENEHGDWKSLVKHTISPYYKLDSYYGDRYKKPEQPVEFEVAAELGDPLEDTIVE